MATNTTTATMATTSSPYYVKNTFVKSSEGYDACSAQSQEFFKMQEAQQSQFFKMAQPQKSEVPGTFGAAEADTEAAGPMTTELVGSRDVRNWWA